MIEPRAIGSGCGVVVLAVTAAGAVPDLRGAAWVGVLALVCAGVLGGLIAGTPIEGSRRRRVTHGLASGVGGGVAFGVVLWYTMTTPGAPEGVFYGISYVVATSRVLSPAAAARYDAAIPIVLAAAGVVVFAVCGAIGGGLAPDDRP